MRLPRRLAAVAALLPESGGVADIGTDHGLIPVYLAKAGRYVPIVATDINEGPLLRAESNCQRHSVRDKVSFRKGDGLAPLNPGEVGTVIIAGMGEATIVEILKSHRQKAETFTTFILQPMDGAEELRRFIWQLDWCINAESVVLERRKFYQTIRVLPHGHFRVPRSVQENHVGLSQEEVVTLGALLLERKDPDFARMIEERLKSRLATRSHIIAGSGGKHRERLRELDQEITKLKKVMKWLSSGT